MTRRLKTTEFINDSFGVKMNHEELLKENKLVIYRFSVGNKSVYPDKYPTTIEGLESMKKDIDEIISMCKRIKLEEAILIEADEVMKNA